MMTWIIGIAAFVVGGATGAALLWVRSQSRIASVEVRNRLLDEQAARLTEELNAQRQESREAAEKRHEAERRVATLDEKLQSRDQQFAEQKRTLEEAEKKLITIFEAAGARVLQTNTEQFLKRAEQSFEQTAKPLRELLEKQNKSLDEIEKKRLEDKSGLQKHLEMIAQAHEKLGTETSRLVTALRRPEQRGRWGEMQLRNVVELAGMTEHCDFREQVQTDDPNTRDRPDMIVRLPGDAVIVVDAKVSLDAYLNSIQPDADRAAELQRHARQVEAHVRGLASKSYWNQFERTPKLVVMFMPLESALTAALEVKPDLHASAMEQHVLIATPTLLVAMLRAIAYGWQQEAIAENARHIADAGRELYDRLATFVAHFERVGKGLEGATKSYNQAIGSLESRVLVSARRLRELRATNENDIDVPSPVEIDVRDVTVEELRALPRQP